MIDFGAGVTQTGENQINYSKPLWTRSYSGPARVKDTFTRELSVEITGSTGINLSPSDKAGIEASVGITAGQTYTDTVSICGKLAKNQKGSFTVYGRYDNYTIPVYDFVTAQVIGDLIIRVPTGLHVSQSGPWADNNCGG